jgi:acetyl-CoA carboxylase biotin carboxylase subunit
MVTGIDLVCEQIRIAAGERLSIKQKDVSWTGAAIECRVYAEDPDKNFLPSPGKITRLRTPSGPGVRDDSGVYEGWEVPLFYDPMISKLAAWGATREEAIARMQRALGEYHVGGIRTTIPFFQSVLSEEDFRSGDIDTGYIARFQERQKAKTEPESQPELSDIQIAAAIAAATDYTRQMRAQKNSALTTQSAQVSKWKAAGRAVGRVGR